MLDTILKGLERRSAPPAVYGRQPAFAHGFPVFGQRTTTGQNMTVDTALELVAVYGAVSLLAGAIGSLPLKVYRDSEPRKEARGSRQWRILHDQPNEEMAADEFWETVAACLLLWGNAFLFKERDTAGIVQKLWPIRPSRVQVGRDANPDGTSVRYFLLNNLRDTKLYETDILHVRGLGTDGQVGLSPVQQARQQLANDQARDQFEGSFWKNGMFSSAVFTHPNRLSQEAQDRLREQIANRSGWLQAGQVLTLEEGADLKNLTMPLEDAQFVEQAGLSDHRVAQLFGLVPPHQWGVGMAGKSMTYTNSEFGGLEFVKWSVRRWLIRIERSLQRDAGLFPSPGPVLFPEFTVDALLRANTLDRYQAYQIALQSGFLSIAQVQALENIEPDGSEGTAGPGDQPEITPSPSDSASPDQTPAGLAAGNGNARRALPQPAGAIVEGTLAIERRGLGVLEDLRSIFRPEIRVEVAAPEVHVPRQLPPDVLAPVEVNVDMGPVAEALDRLTEAVTGKELAVNVAAPTVNMPAQPVQLTLLEPEEPPLNMAVEFQRNPNGTIKSATVTEAAS